jgi:NADH-quinone oxidoreductase subunit D
MTLNVGPQHPATHGVLRLKLKVDGERIVGCYPIIGYLHRGTEKLFELHPFFQNVPHTDRMDYVAAATNNLAYVGAVEKLVGLVVPPRARYIRTILCELQRISSHLLWLATHAIDIGAMTPFFYCFRERELILDVFEALTGCRFHYNTHCVGGNRHDIPAGWANHVKQALDLIEARMSEYLGLLDHPVFLARTRDVGTLDAELALELGLSGPLLRASGIDCDLRRDAPYQVYDRLDVRVAVDSGGDCYARYKVRVMEIAESIRLARMLIDGIPSGPISAAKPLTNVVQHKITAGQAYVAIETPRGELGTWLIAGGKGNSPYRMKIRPPSLHALGAVPYLFPRHNVSDAVAILGSLDPIMGEADR